MKKDRQGRHILRRVSKIHGMISSTINAKAKEVSFDDDNFHIHFYDGRILSVPLVFFPRLLHATKQQRESYTISGGGSGLHWEDIDEDISVNGLLLGISDRTKMKERI